jgi:mannose-6-phosphate isomerase-like protein (cupin superfamily)
MSCTDKNTMVFVVLEGEITVILHTTQFNAKKGDSFYIPPKVKFWYL